MIGYIDTLSNPHAEVFLCDDGDLGISARNTYESIIEFMDWDFWFVMIPRDDADSITAKSWSENLRGVIVVDHRKLVGGFVSRNVLYDIFPKSHWFNRIAPGVVLNEDYMIFSSDTRQDKTIGAIGAIGYSIHGNWEGIEGCEVPPMHLAHILDDVLWSWRVDEYRYEPPFHNIACGNYDHQLHLHSRGMNCMTAPSSCAQYLPQSDVFDKTIGEAAKEISSRWSKKIDFFKTSEITRM